MKQDNYRPRKKCGAKTQRGKGPPCTNWAMDNGRCRLHGGASPKGVSSPHFKHGRYAQRMPVELQERFEAALNDQALLDLRSEIALVDTRLGQLMERLGAGVTPEWFNAMERIERLIPTLESGDEEDVATATEAIRDIVSHAIPDYTAWEQVFKLVEQRRKLVDSEAKRVKDAQWALTIEEAMGISTALANAALMFIPTEEAKREYYLHVERIFQITTPDALPS